MYYTDEEIAKECQMAKTLLAAGNLKEALSHFVKFAIADARAWEPQNLPGEDNNAFNRELCDQLKSKYQNLDYPIRMHLLWKRIIIDDDLEDVLEKLWKLYETSPCNEFVLISLAYCHEKLGLYRTCMYFCSQLRRFCLSSGFYGADTESVDYTNYLIIDCLYELGEYGKMLDLIGSLKEVSEYSTVMTILAYRSLRMYDKAVEVARNYLRLYDSADVEFFYGHLRYLENRMDLGYETLCHLIEKHYESEYTPFALCYIGREAEGIELARKRVASKSSGKYIFAEVLSLIGNLEESFRVLDDFLKSSESVGKGRYALLVDPALQNLLIDGGGLELAQEHIKNIEKQDNDELSKYKTPKNGLHGIIRINYTVQESFLVVPLRVWSLDMKAILATACERTILSSGSFFASNATKFVFKSRQFGEITVFEGVVDIVLDVWIIRDQPVLFSDSLNYNILGADVLSKAESLDVDNVNRQITIRI